MGEAVTRYRQSRVTRGYTVADAAISELEAELAILRGLTEWVEDLPEQARVIEKTAATAVLMEPV